ncbi:hypothetical protein D9M71_314700 [compost metagenome]
MTRHQIQQGTGLEGFDQVIGGALANRIHCTLDSPEGRHQQHRELRVALADDGQQLVAVHARHVDVAHHQAEGLFTQRHQGGLGAIHGAVVIATDHQGVRQGFTQGAVVFDQQNFGSHRSLLL